MESRVNPIKAMQGLELGHVVAASTDIIGVEATVHALVETMNDVIKKESRSEAADICMSAMLAFIGDLYGTATTQPISKKKANLLPPCCSQRNGGHPGKRGRKLNSAAGIVRYTKLAALSLLLLKKYFIINT